jgi:hypothetical protein
VDSFYERRLSEGGGVSGERTVCVDNNALPSTPFLFPYLNTRFPTPSGSHEKDPGQGRNLGIVKVDVCFWFCWQGNVIVFLEIVVMIVVVSVPMIIRRRKRGLHYEEDDNSDRGTAPTMMNESYQ